MLYRLEHDAIPISVSEPFANESEDPRQISKFLIIRMLRFIADIEQLFTNPLFAEAPSFLDKFSANVLALHYLTHHSSSYEEPLQEAACLIENILTCNILIDDQDFEISTLDAAKIHRKMHHSQDPLAALLKKYLEHSSHIVHLLNELKILAHDLSEGKENI